MMNKIKIKKEIDNGNDSEQIDEVSENKIFDPEGELVVDV